MKHKMTFNNYKAYNSHFIWGFLCDTNPLYLINLYLLLILCSIRNLL
jgi:hypothetical protein